MCTNFTPPNRLRYRQNSTPSYRPTQKGEFVPVTNHDVIKHADVTDVITFVGDMFIGAMARACEFVIVVFNTCVCRRCYIANQSECGTIAREKCIL